MKAKHNYFLAAYPNGRVNHAWKLHQFSPYYVQSACGELVGHEYPVDKPGLRLCKKCKERGKL